MTTTLRDVLTEHAPEITTDLDLALAVPIVDFARQGDVLIAPEHIAELLVEPTTAVPAEGVALVRGEFGGNTHLLVVDGDAMFDRVPPRAPGDIDALIAVGSLEIGEGSRGYLIHPEHGAIGILPGRYAIRRQREWDEVVRLVTD